MKTKNILGVEVMDLGENPIIDEVVIGQRYVINDLDCIEGYYFYLDEIVSGSIDDEHIMIGTLRIIDTLPRHDWTRHSGFILCTVEGDYIYE